MSLAFFMTILKIHEQSLLLQYEFVDLNNLLGASLESDYENNLLQHWWVFVHTRRLVMM